MESQATLHVHVPVTEKIGLAIIALFREALAKPLITQQQLDELNAEINQDSAALSAAVSPPSQPVTTEG